MIPLAAGTFVHQAAGPGSRIEVHNASRAHVAHVFRIGLVPVAPPLSSDVEWSWFSVSQRREALRLVASSDGRSGSLRLTRDAAIYSAVLDAGRHVVHEITAGRGVWLHVVVGGGHLGTLELASGDGAGLVQERAISFTSSEATEILVVDLPPVQVILGVDPDLALEGGAPLTLD